MKKILFFTVALFLLSCGNNPTVDVENSDITEISINHKVYKIASEKIIATETPDMILIAIPYANRTSIIDEMGFYFYKNGALARVYLRNTEEEGILYGANDFEPHKFLHIKNFKFDEITQNIFFEYDGQLLLSSNEKYNIKYDPKTISVKGKIKLKTTKSSISRLMPFANFQSSTIDFKTIEQKLFLKLNSEYPMEALERYDFYYNYISDNGYRLVFKNNRKLDNLSVGTVISFDEKATRNCMYLMKFVGKPRASQEQYLIDEDWIAYPCKGSLRITEQIPQLAGDEKRTKGIFNIEVYNDGKVIHRIDNGTFNIAHYAFPN